jgi:hypothetical protein
MSGAASVVVDYLTAFTAGDMDRARSLVSEDFSFRGPRGGTEGRDEFFAAATWIGPYLRGVRILRQWEDGDDVSSLYEYDLGTKAGAASIRISEWSTVRDGQLTSALAVFDTAGARDAVKAGPRKAA